MSKIVPNQNESPFGFHEFFFSTTNARGVIRYGNDVFVRVSDYPKDQILGAPHSIVRHPDMPRSVFKVFWDTLKSGNAIGAYVKNLSANGSYYWVFAFAFPIEDGYLSIRFKPSSEIFKAVQSIYKEVRSFEAENNDLGASERLLIEKIQSQGFKDYEDFMVKAVIAELNSRTVRAADLESKTFDQENEHGRAIAEYSKKTLATLTEMFVGTKSFQNTNKIITETVESLGQGFRNLKLISLNMTVAAAKFGDIAAGLGVVSQEFSTLSTEIETQLKNLDSFAEQLSKTIQQCTFRISALNSQMLMVDFFVKEALQKMNSSDDAFTEMNENKKDFSTLFREYATKMGEEVSSLMSDASGIEKNVEEVRRLVTGLEVIRQIGGIESARVDEIKRVFNHYLDEMNNFVALLRKSTANVSTEVRDLRSRCSFIVDQSGKIAGDVQKIFDLAATVNRHKN
ncbi:MAG: methyl-accepting chemotaxis protein [Bdellovibrionaceae bacterium]|nr:methyl-accepting chemotaxis protein [Pseudobdellovibrionaceae bacterium]